MAIHALSIANLYFGISLIRSNELRSRLVGLLNLVLFLGITFFV